jgi:rhomboid protease GluP
MNLVAASASSPLVTPGEATPSSDLRSARRRSAEPSWFAYPATYVLIGINVLVFLAMVPFGPVPGLLRQHAFGAVLTAEFAPNVLVHFGASTPDRILLYGEWWRLVTSIFVHVTLLHIALNMWCLWNLGLFGEPLLGRPGLVAVYLLTGAAGMLQSLAISVFSRQLDVVAGASGAIFGIAGILIVLL